MMKIATFNTNSVRMRIKIINEWLSRERPTVLCLQETKAQDKDFPKDAFGEAGYQAVFLGQKSYNGVALLSNEPITEIEKGLQDSEEDQEQARFISGVINGIRVVNVYVPQGYEPGSEKFAYKLSWLRRLRAYFERNCDSSDGIVLTGDFNVAPEPRDVYDPDRMAGSIGFHPDEHEALARVREWGFVDVFRRHVPDAGQFTFWDYRLRGGVSRNLGWRIDHIWATAPLAEKSVRAWIDKEPRFEENPSDHTFLVAEFDV